MNSSDLSKSILSIRYKIAFIGNICVGKTSVMLRFLTNNFSETYDVTLFLFVKSANYRSRF